MLQLVCGVPPPREMRVRLGLVVVQLVLPTREVNTVPKRLMCSHSHTQTMATLLQCRQIFLDEGASNFEAG